MAWGSACSNCGREDCSWVQGDDCEGRSATRAQPAPADVVERLIARVEDCQRDCPAGHNNLSGRLTAIRETLVALTLSGGGS
jgi:hypothetical protein